MITNLKRIIKFAWKDFVRNPGINFAAIFILIVPILLATFLFLFQGLSGSVIDQVKGKIDVAAYFKDGATEEDILNVKSELLKLSSEIKDVQYVSKEQALIGFKERHKDDPDFLQALEEVGGNPFFASLNIKTETPLQYEKVTNFLTIGPFADFIEKVDYSQKKETIEKVFNITSDINRFGLAISIILFLIAIAVVLNTVKLAIDNSKDEITAMRLVGASNWFIWGPFVVQSIICGVIALAVCLLLSGLVCYFFGPKLEILVPGFDLFNYFFSSFWIILLLQIVFGIILGSLATFILVRSYLKV